MGKGGWTKFFFTLGVLTLIGTVVLQAFWNTSATQTAALVSACSSGAFSGMWTIMSFVNQTKKVNEANDNFTDQDPNDNTVTNRKPWWGVLTGLSGLLLIASAVLFAVMTPSCASSCTMLNTAGLMPIATIAIALGGTGIVGGVISFYKDSTYTAHEFGQSGVVCGDKEDFPGADFYVKRGTGAHQGHHVSQTSPIDSPVPTYDGLAYGGPQNDAANFHADAGHGGTGASQGDEEDTMGQDPELGDGLEKPAKPEALGNGDLKSGSDDEQCMPARADKSEADDKSEAGECVISRRRRLVLENLLAQCNLVSKCN